MSQRADSPRPVCDGGSPQSPARIEEPTGRNRQALNLFAPIAGSYERWSRILSLGQDPRWRREMVDGLDLPPGSLVADVAAGTGLVSRLLQERGYRVIAVDQSPEMLAHARDRGVEAIQAQAENLPFDDGSFDGLTFTYLLRYVDDPLATLRELARVVRPGGVIGMVEFGLPRGIWRPAWIVYTRMGLPGAGLLIRSGWREVGQFLGPSIEEFHRQFPDRTLERLWEEAGLVEVRRREMSRGGGLVMWGWRR